ncbi:MAG TPA: alpha/beta hydrolase family protein [Pyrinomonadaceae bacterium]|nr:alpha/beta hydrolase family protein [Pyrinomonadaceae bacterium]
MIHWIKQKGPIVSLLVCLSATISLAQQPPTGQMADLRFGGQVHELDSKLMARKMPYWIFLPERYFDKTESGRQYPVVYLLHGLTGRFTNWPELARLAEYLKEMEMIVVSVEGGNGWYTDSFTKENDRYESYIIRELIPEVDRKFRTISEREHRAIAGLSMGGYGAIKFGLKYPEMFVLAGSFSGAFGAATLDERTGGSAIARSLEAIFGPQDSETRKANDLFDIVRRSSPETIKTWPFIYVDCGTEDFLFQNNRDFVSLLVEKRVPHEYRQLPGAHNWQYWDKQIEEFLRVARKRFGLIK